MLHLSGERKRWGCTAFLISILVKVYLLLASLPSEKSYGTTIIPLLMYKPPKNDRTQITAGRVDAASCLSVPIIGREVPRERHTKQWNQAKCMKGSRTVRSIACKVSTKLDAFLEILLWKVKAWTNRGISTRKFQNVGVNHRLHLLEAL